MPTSKIGTIREFKTKNFHVVIDPAKRREAMATVDANHIRPLAINLVYGESEDSVRQRLRGSAEQIDLQMEALRIMEVFYREAIERNQQKED
jgi:hypothetical protein